MRWLALLCVAALLTGCGEDPSDPDASPGEDAGSSVCELDEFELGDPDGHPEPLGVGPGEARAGRLTADQLPDFPSGLQVWEGGDFVLANEHVALVIEDAGQSELYDPWGGRPLGVARVEGGALVEPGDFGEILVMIGAMTVFTQTVTVLDDGSDGGAAVIRAQGPPRRLPFFADLVGPLLSGDFEDFDAVIDYVLEPGARHVDVFIELRSPDVTERSTTTMHAFMHTPRMPPFARGVGFDTEGETVPWAGFADPRGTSFAYRSPTLDLGGGLEISGFVSFFTRGAVARACTENRIHHAQIVIGGPGAGGLLAAVLEADGEASRTVTGTVSDAAGAPAADAWVLAQDADGFLSRTLTGDDGTYSLVLPEASSAELIAFRRGDDPTAPVAVDSDTVDLAFGDGGLVHVTATAPDGTPLPVRVQLLEADGSAAPQPAGSFGIPAITRARRQMDFALDGDSTLRAPAGPVRVVVSRGYEYELVDRVVDVVAGETVEVDVTLERVIDTAGAQCADFHIHTARSNDSGDDGAYKVASAVADGVELPVRSTTSSPATSRPRSPSSASKPGRSGRARSR